MIVDVSEIAALVDITRRVRRCTEGYSAFLSIVTMLVCGIVPISVVLAVDGYESHYCGGKLGKEMEECEREESRWMDADKYTFIAWILPITVA